MAQFRCEVCGKTFTIRSTKQWGWKFGSHCQCSYTCMRKLENGEKPKYKFETVRTPEQDTGSASTVSAELINSLDAVYGGLKAEEGQDEIEIPIKKTGRQKGTITPEVRGVLEQYVAIKAREPELIQLQIAERIGVKPKYLNNALYRNRALADQMLEEAKKAMEREGELVAEERGAASGAPTEQLSPAEDPSPEGDSSPAAVGAPHCDGEPGKGPSAVENPSAADEDPKEAPVTVRCPEWIADGIAAIAEAANVTPDEAVKAILGVTVQHFISGVCDLAVAILKGGPGK